MSAGLERDLLEQEWNGIRQLRPGMALDTSLRWFGDEGRVTIETVGDEDTMRVFYGPIDEAQRWIDALQRDLDEADMGDIAQIWDVTLTDGAEVTGNYVARGWGDIERGYVNTLARGMQERARRRAEETGQSPSPSIVRVAFTETRERHLEIPLEALPPRLRAQLADGIISDLPPGDRGALGILCSALGDSASVPVTYDRIERHVEQRFLP